MRVKKEWTHHNALSISSTLLKIHAIENKEKKREKHTHIFDGLMFLLSANLLLVCPSYYPESLFTICLMSIALKHVNIRFHDGKESLARAWLHWKLSHFLIEQTGFSNVLLMQNQPKRDFTWFEKGRVLRIFFSVFF